MDNEITLTVKPDEEIIESLIICIKPNGNKSVNIKRGKRSDRALIAACEAKKVDTFVIPDDDNGNKTNASS
jgi:hypothetical protein